MPGDISIGFAQGRETEIILERKVLGSDPKSLQKNFPFDSVDFGSSPKTVREHQYHRQDE